MTQHDMAALRDAITQNTVSELRADRIMDAAAFQIALVAADRDRLRVAWTSARRRARRWKYTADLRASVRNRVSRQLDRAVEERDAARAEVAEFRRALRSALSSPDEPGVHTTLAHMRRLAGLDDAQAADGDRLPERDLVEPGDEVPTLCEFEGRMDSLEMRLSAVEERLSPVDQRGMAAPAPAPVRYRDRLGDVWEDQGDGTLRLIGVRADRREHLLTVLPHDVVEQRHGILARMPGGAR